MEKQIPQESRLVKLFEEIRATASTNLKKFYYYLSTFMDFDHGGHLTSIEADPLNRHF